MSEEFENELSSVDEDVTEELNDDQDFIESDEESIESSSIPDEIITDDEIQVFDKPLFPPESYNLDGGKTIPAISPYQDEGTEIYNISALGAFDENFIRLTELKQYYNELEHKQHEEEEKALDFSEVEPSDKVSRILVGLQDVTERFRENLYDIVDPPILASRKERRLHKKKSFVFVTSGFRKMIQMMEKHMNALVVHGHYPEETFKNFKQCAENALNAKNEQDALSYGMDVLLCAEAVMPMEETVRPQKRISEGIASPTGMI